MLENLSNLASLLFHLLPRNALSWLVGATVRLRLPSPLNTSLNRAFAKAFKLKLDEAELPLERFGTIEDVFTRKLKPGMRPIAGIVCSPADGFLAQSQSARGSDEAVQAKGLTYSLAELVFGSTPRSAPAPDYAWYQTIYLAPHNYHRVHAPFSGLLTAIRYLPGDLWPVNQTFVARIPRLFNRNERLVFDFDLAVGGKASVVMVGAYNVGRMVTPLLPHIVTNALSRLRGAVPSTHLFPEPVAVAIGDELGTFMLGSTVVIAFDRAAMASGIRLVQTAGNRPILMGQSLVEVAP